MVERLFSGMVIPPINWWLGFLRMGSEWDDFCRWTALRISVLPFSLWSFSIAIQIYIYMYIDRHTHIYIYMYIYMYVEIRICICMYMYINVYIYMYVYVCICMYMYVYVCMHACMYVYIYIFIHMYRAMEDCPFRNDIPIYLLKIRIFHSDVKLPEGHHHYFAMVTEASKW